MNVEIECGPTFSCAFPLDWQDLFLFKVKNFIFIKNLESPLTFIYLFIFKRWNHVRTKPLKITPNFWKSCPQKTQVWVRWSSYLLRRYLPLKRSLLAKLREIWQLVNWLWIFRWAKVIFKILSTLASQTRIQNTIIKKLLYCIPEHQFKHYHKTSMVSLENKTHIIHFTLVS